MSEENSVSSHIFSAITFKAVDYDCEVTTSLKVTMNWLALPMPYLHGDSDLYLHSGKLPEVTYRKPWIRGNVVSACKLFVGGSVLEDLGGNGQPVNSLERLSISVSAGKGDPVEVIPSSNPDSQVDLDRDEALWLLQESQRIDICQESFSKSTTEQICPLNQHEDLLMPEEVVLVDPLPQFRRHLPTLKVKLSRLRNLPVTDPLLSSTGGTLSEDAIIRHCASYETPPDVDIENSRTCSNAYEEEFGKEPLMNDESLLLPVELDSPTFNRENFSHFPSIRDVLNVAPEAMEEHISSLDLLRTATPSDALGTVDISQFEATMGPTTTDISEGPSDTRSAGRLMLPTEMEVDLTLTPSPKASRTQLWPSPSQLPMEQLSPVYKHCLVSERDQEEMEKALWKAEKHPTFVLGFLLAEPQICEPAVDFQPLAEAFRLPWISPEVSVSISGKIKLQPQFWTEVPEEYSTGACDFTETTISECPQAKEDDVEDFTILSTHQIEYILKIWEEDGTPPVPISEVRARSILKNPTQPAMTSPQDEEESREDPSIAEAPTYTTTNKEEARGDTSQNCFSAHPTSATSEKEKDETSVFSPFAVTTNSKDRIGEMFSADASTSSSATPPEETFGHTARPVRRKDESRPEQSASVPEQTIPSRPSVGANHWGVSVAGPPPQKDPDPLSTFMMLRSQQRASLLVTPQIYTSTPVPKVEQQTPQPAPAPDVEQTLVLDRKPVFMSGVVTGNATRTLEPVRQTVGQADTQPVTQEDRHDSKVVQVQATESQWRAYCELLAFALPCLARAKELGLDSAAWADFNCLAPDQTRFLVKQQEQELSRTQGHDQEQLFNQVALIHVLVTVKDLLLKCDLNTAVEYLGRAAEACAGQSLEQLVKRLQILLYLSHHNQEPNPKLLELQDQLATWLHSRKGQKVLVVTAVDSDRTRSMLIKGLSQVTGEAVIAVCPEEGKSKLNGARVLNSVRSSVCVVVCGQHMGADFPWHSFSQVVEYDRSVHSPWSAICRERNISHLSFHTALPDAEGETDCWSLEHSIPYVLIVTEGLLNCPLLLQILESTYNMTVLERGHCPSLQTLGGTHHYAVVTVDESTAVIIQGQDELCQGRACESVVMRLTALSLQYSCCWLILHCPASQGGGLTSEGFNNLVLIYSSLVLFGMKSENLDVKVLIVSEVVDIARWVSHICFHSLIASDRDPLRYLDRRWLAVMPSEEEKCLLEFPCVNPLVGQLMLSRAPSLQWLLGAPLSVLEELLPEVPHKVIKLFSDTTSLYKLTTDPSSPDSHIRSTQKDHSPPNTTWTTSRHPRHTPTDPHSEPFCTNHATSFPSGYPRTESIAGSFYEPSPGISLQDDNADFQVDLSHTLRSSEVHFQNSWTNNSPWKEEEGGREEVKSASWHGGVGGEGRGVESGEEDWIQRVSANHDPYVGPRGTSSHHPHSITDNPLELDSSFCYSANPLQPAHSNSSQLMSYTRDHKYPDSHYPALGSSRGAVPWGGGIHSNGSPYSSRESTRISPEYGSNFWMGQERKRSGEVTGTVGTALPPLKRGKLSYERVPGRSDGQTRLRFF